MEVTNEVERFNGVRTPRHQICHRLEIFLADTRQRDLHEVETIWEIQQPTCDKADPFGHTQLERPVETRRGQGSLPFVGPAPAEESIQSKIFEEGKGAQETENLGVFGKVGVQAKRSNVRWVIIRTMERRRSGLHPDRGCQRVNGRGC